ncbi:glycerol-3-phosphate 1-O-acyltransferase PlsB [Neptunomonas marina]|uniref:Glycerol-3-phosphate acyltransferase n=1 Tax=Neptunomonas marina TaxID=1815562 RepID=A0A437Q7E1_9GAMM|nr:glycerol-3-phosphate 1-O-acyltransferase PlsB [Neptunomonas marina]RVU30396.1 glycerol-3-phosphate 1-O-acyltransferase PlsB [Neptunomonas marina]
MNRHHRTTNRLPMLFSSWLKKPLLRMLVNTNVQGQHHLKQSNQTLYILETDRTSHQLLLKRCMKDAGFERPLPLILTASHHHGNESRQRLEAQVERLGFLADDQDIEVVPVSIFHGRMPRRETSLFNLLSGEHWNTANPLRRALQVLVNGRDTLIQVGRPLSLKALVQSHPDQPSGVYAHKALRLIQTYFHRRRKAILGPALLNRSAQLSLILKDPDVKAQIHALAAQEHAPYSDIEQQAYRELDKIAANFSPATARVLSYFLGLFWTKVYRRVHVTGIDKVQEASIDSQVVYLPCHRSHMDYVILSWNLYQHGLMIPHIAAGDNLNAPILGSILKRGGAVFMRRSFRGDKLYATLFKSYLRHMAARGHALEYFLEGGRSRTGRLLSAKAGLLTMTIENYLRDSSKPVTLVPVWISYDKLVESKSYQKELDGGKKAKESLWGLLVTLKSFTRQFGDAALSFGEPIPLALPSTIDDNLADQAKQMAPKFATEVLTKINAAAYVNQTALIATLLLGSPQLRIEKQHAHQALHMLKALLLDLPNPPADIAAGEPERWLKKALQRDQVSIDEEHYYLTAHQAREMTFYRNQLHHMLLLPSIYLLLAKRYAKPRLQTLPVLIRPLFQLMQRELFLPWQAQDLPEVFRRTRQALEAQACISHDKNGAVTLSDNPLSIVLMQTAEPVLLRYFIVLRVLQHNSAMLREELLQESQRIAAELHHLFGFNSPEYSDIRTLDSFVETLLEQGALGSQDGLISAQFATEKLLQRAKQILNQQAVSSIESHLSPK